MTNKKGISPLIATVLIIGFTIVAAILVITWINSLIGEQTDDQACRSAAYSECIDFATSGALQFTPTTGNGTYTIEVSNGGLATAKLNVIFIDSTGSTATCTETIVPIEVSAGNSETSTCTSSDVAKVRVVQTVSKTTLDGFDNDCIVTCSEGKTLEF